MLMLYNIYVIVIYDGMYVMNKVNILYQKVLLTIITLLRILYQQVVREFGDGCGSSWKENGTYSAAGVLWVFFGDGVRRFLVMEVVLVWWIVVVEIDNVCGSKCKSRYLFSC